jgi:predicted HicB family RNase H-like nuclease
MMEYKGYIGKVEFDDEAGVFHGEVINLRDVITFQGETVEELRQAFRESVNDYLAFCAERHEEPEKPFSGTFTVRIPPELHRDIALQAKLTGRSLNAWVSDLLAAAARGAGAAPWASGPGAFQPVGAPARVGEARANYTATTEEGKRGLGDSS